MQPTDVPGYMAAPATALDHPWTAAAFVMSPYADLTLAGARQTATADVQVTLDITPGVPHFFQAHYPILDEAAAALDRIGQLLSAHLASAERVTPWRKAYPGIVNERSST